MGAVDHRAERIGARWPPAADLARPRLRIAQRGRDGARGRRAVPRPPPHRRPRLPRRTALAARAGSGPDTRHPPAGAPPRPPHRTRPFPGRPVRTVARVGARRTARGLGRRALPGAPGHERGRHEPRRARRPRGPRAARARRAGEGRRGTGRRLPRRQPLPGGRPHHPPPGPPAPAAARGRSAGLRQHRRIRHGLPRTPRTTAAARQNGRGGAAGGVLALVPGRGLLADRVYGGEHPYEVRQHHGGHR